MSLISGKDCVPETSLEEMMVTKRLFGKTRGRQYIHLVQSFPKNETVTHKQAHILAQQLADRFEGFQVLISTHKDRDHVHSHLLINSVNFETGKKWQQSISEMDTVKGFSDQLCRSAGLSVIESKGKLNMSRAEYKVAEAGESWKWQLINTIEAALCESATKEDFIEHLQLHGYGVNWTDNRKYITYTTPEGFKCRDKKLQNNKYTKEAMKNEFSLRKHEIKQQSPDSDHGTQLDQGKGTSNRKSISGDPRNHEGRKGNSRQQRISAERGKQAAGSISKLDKSGKCPVRKDDRSR